MRTILVTGFEPFGGSDINPSWDAVAELPEEIAGARIVTRQLPCAFGQSVEVVERACAELEPDAIVLVGLAAGRAGITPERVAINVDDARIPDNAGQKPLDRPIAAHGPAAYFSTLPVKAMVEAIREEGLPASLSNSAGTFVCNHVMYGVLHHLACSESSGVLAGFIHVPAVPDMLGDDTTTPTLTRAEITRGLHAALEALVKHGAKDVTADLGTLQ